MPNLQKIYLGIDWGTHPSKWAAKIVQNQMELTSKSGVIKSELVFNGKEIIINPDADYYPEKERKHSLKKKIINDPFAPFWEHNRKDIGMPLGMGVVFSICSLFGAFINKLKSENIIMNAAVDLDIGFSFPNWLSDDDEESKIAVNNYHQAILASCYVFQFFKSDLPIPNIPYPVDKWNALVKKIQEKLIPPDNFVIEISDMAKNVYYLNDFNNEHFKWRYLVESCAAGLPYLRTIEIQEPPGLRGLGKLLVIDIGAGSTDIGYMLRTISLYNQENLYYFRPASSLNIAGNDLTEEIKRFRRIAERAVTFSEAEDYKISRTEEWADKPFVDIWRKSIGKHVNEYIANLQDHRWLNSNVPLEIIITGGSGLVYGLPEEIQTSVSTGLRKRGLSENISENTRAVNKSIPGWNFETVEDYARCAVAIGCSDPDKPLLKHLPRMNPVAPGHIYTPYIRYRENG
jgi:hypothetical protein